MLTSDVKKLPPLERFLYWVAERHRIYLKRKRGESKPWTDDEVLRSFFFTNPYRENDRVTVWFRDHIREPLRDDPRVLFATVAFRWFNLPETAEVLMAEDEASNLLLNWDKHSVLYRLRKVRDSGGKVFTGAYMINSPAGEPKLEAIVRRINNVWQARGELLSEIEPPMDPSGASETMETAHRALTRFDGMGGFMAYEVVCDLRYTYLLEDAPDKMTWCNPGPGCARGLLRLAEEPFEKGNNATSPPLPKDWLKRMTDLLATMNKRLDKMPRFEMREAEHSLCEWDKYERALWGDGKMKRTYSGV